MLIFSFRARAGRLLLLNVFLLNMVASARVSGVHPQGIALTPLIL